MEMKMKGVSWLFLCESCLEKNFKNFAIPFSHGKCEHCEKIKSCVDIPSKYLVKKVNKKEEYNFRTNKTDILS